MENTIEERISEWEEKNKQKSIYVELFRAEILSGVIFKMCSENDT